MFKTHGLSKTNTYKVWKNMKGRCDNPNHPQYKDWGGRGITYDSQWELFENFLRDMGEKPEGKSLDRCDNNKSYCKNNCRWATREEQQRNTRSFRGTSPMTGVRWDSRGNGRWRAYTKMVKGKRKMIYSGKNLNVAIEARKFYESFILGL